MISTKLASIGVAAALAAVLPAMPAQAQVARTFLSAAGSDSNNCANVVTPCRHLAVAYAATAANGEIYVLDPANYGSLTITGPVSIEGHGWASIAPVLGNAAITINANPGDAINIVGVVLDGTNIAFTTGIQFNSGGSLTISDSVIRNFKEYGILFQPNTTNPSQPSQLFVSNTLVSDNGGDGINITSTNFGNTSGVLDHVKMVHNSGSGLRVNSGTAPIDITVSDSVSTNNASNGIWAQSTGGASINVMMQNSTITYNGGGLAADGAIASIRATRSTIRGNGTGWENAPGGQVTSYVDNNIEDNLVVNTAPVPIIYK
jgi:hypothetical protein